MKKFILATLALSIALPALADKVEVNKEILKEIEDANALDLARVYLSKTLKIERASAAKKVSEVETGVSRVVRQNILKEEISKKVRGKIIAIEGTEDSNFVHTSDEVTKKLLTIYVSFDKSCLSKDCAFAFRMPGELRYYSHSYEFGNLYHFRKYESFFALSEIAPVKDMTITKLSVHRPILSDPKLVKNGTTYYAKGKSVKLLIDLSELKEITINKIKHGGF